MAPLTATVVFAVGMLGLFALDRDRKARTSKALWIPVVWLSISGSRTVSEWLGTMGFASGTALNSPDQLLDGSALDRNIWMGLIAVARLVLLGRRKQVRRRLGANGQFLVL